MQTYHLTEMIELLKSIDKSLKQLVEEFNCNRELRNDRKKERQVPNKN